MSRGLGDVYKRQPQADEWKVAPAKVRQVTYHNKTDVEEECVEEKLLLTEAIPEGFAAEYQTGENGFFRKDCVWAWKDGIFLWNGDC